MRIKKRFDCVEEVFLNTEKNIMIRSYSNFSVSYEKNGIRFEIIAKITTKIETNFTKYSISYDNH